jgi:hypothetical protein
VRRVYPDTEVIKHDPGEYGGWQNYNMTPDVLLQRLCVARRCGNPGYIQMLTWPPEDNDPPTLRILCRSHLVKVSMAIAVVLGDPSPVGEVNDLLRRMGVEGVAADWLREYPYAEPLMPEDFRCLACGGAGRLMAETQGLYKGRRWIHTCEESK